MQVSVDRRLRFTALLFAEVRMVEIVRVYNNGDRKRFKMSESEADRHLEYSIKARFGCAHFRDGRCVSFGYLGKERCKVIEQELSK